MEEIKWICVNDYLSKERIWDASSLADGRNKSINMFVIGTGDIWKFWYRNYGWRCIKVKVTITPI